MNYSVIPLSLEEKWEFVREVINEYSDAGYVPPVWVSEVYTDLLNEEEMMYEKYMESQGYEWDEEEGEWK